MKRIFFKGTLLIGILSMVMLSLGACAPASTPTTAPVVPTSPPAPTAEPAVTEVTFWHIYTDAMAGAGSWFKDTAADFEAANPNIKVQIETFGSDPYKTKLPSAISANEAADALHVNPGAMSQPYVDAGAIAPLDDYLAVDGWKDEFNLATFEQCTYAGKIYCLPFTVRIVLMWYNKDVFEKYNLTPPADFEELLSIAEILKSNGVTPFALGTKAVWQANFWQTYLIERVAGLEVANNARLNKGNGWQDPGVIEALTIFQDMFKNGYFTTGTLGIDPMDVNPSFYKGEAAMILNGTFFTDQVKSGGPEGFLDNSLGYFTFPLIENGKGNAKVYHGGIGAGYAINANSTSAEKDAVAQYYRFIFTAEKMQDLAKRTNYTTAIKDSIPADASPLLQSINSEIENMGGFTWYVDASVSPEAYLVFTSTLQQLIDLKITPAEAAKMYQDAVNK